MAIALSATAATILTTVLIGTAATITRTFSVRRREQHIQRLLDTYAEAICAPRPTTRQSRLYGLVNQAIAAQLPPSDYRALAAWLELLSSNWDEVHRLTCIDRHRLRRAAAAC